MEQVILDHLHSESGGNCPFREVRLGSLWGIFPNFIKKDGIISSNQSYYYYEAFDTHVGMFVEIYGIKINNRKMGYELALNDEENLSLEIFDKNVLVKKYLHTHGFWGRMKI